MSGDNRQTRNQFIDFAKGIAIFLVVWGHAIQYISWTPVNRYDFYSDNVFKTIYSFHMPLFMLLSGYLFYWSSGRKLPVKLIKSRLRSLFIPMVVWGALGTALKVIEYTEISLFHIVKDLAAETLSIWFLWAVLVSSILVALINGYCPKKLRVFGYVLAYISVFLLPFGELVAFMLPYFVAGYLYNANKDKFPKLNLKGGGTLVIVFIVLLLYYDVQHYIYNSGLNPFSSSYGFIGQTCINIYRYVIGAVGSIAVLWILYCIFSRFSSVKVIKYVVHIGKASLQIYLMQRLILERVGAALWVNLCKAAGTNVFMESHVIFDVVISPVLSLAAVSIIMCCLRLLEKSSRISSFLFGR